MSATLLRLAPLLCGLLVKTTLILLTAWTIVLFLRRASAATRHLVWTAAIGCVLLLPVLTAALPHWDIPWRFSAAPGNVSPQPPVTTVIVSEQQAQTPAAGVSGIPPKQSHFHITLSGLALIGFSVWLTGCLAVLARLAAGLTRIERNRRRARDLEGTAMLLPREAARALGVRRHIQTRLAASAHDIDVPVTWGTVRPVILLPSDSASWSEECLRVALLHETAHVRRLDWTTQTTSRAACAVLWFHPLIWMAASRMREESENACDDLVMRAGVSATDYAQRLVDIVRSMPEKGRARQSAVAMAQPWEVERRLTTVLAKGRNRSPIPSRGLIAAAAVAAMLLLPLATLRITTAQASPAASHPGMAALQPRKSTPAPSTPPVRRHTPSVRAIHTSIPTPRKTTMTPHSHTVVLAGLTAGTLLAHTHNRLILHKPIAIAMTPAAAVTTPENKTDTGTKAPKSGTNSETGLPADYADYEAIVHPAKKPNAFAVPDSKTAVTSAKPGNLTDCVLVSVSTTFTDPQGKVLVKEQPSILLIAGNKGGMILIRQEGSSHLSVQTTVMKDKNIIVDTKLTENVSIDGKTVTYHPHILSKVGQATEATVEDTHGILRFQIDSKLTRQPVNAHPAPKTPAVSAETGTNSFAHPQ